MFNILNNKKFKKLSEIVGLDLNYFFKNSFWIISRYFVIGLSGLLISIAFTRLVTKEFYGQYQFVLNFFALLSVASLPGFNTVALRGVVQGKNGVVKKVIRLSFFASFLAVPVILCYGVYQLIYGNNAVGLALIAGSLLFPFFYAPNTWYVFFEGKSMFKEASYRIILLYAVLTAVMVLALHLKWSLIWVVLTFLLANILMNGIFYLEIIKKVKDFKEKLDIKYGISCTLQKFTYSLSETLPFLIVSFIFGFEFLAVYQIAYYLIALIVGFLAALSSTYMPLLFKYKKINYFKIIWQNLLIGIVFFLGFILFIKIFFFIFYDRGYQESYELAKIFSWIIILIPLRLFLLNFFSSQGKNNIIIVSTIASNVIAFLVLLVIKNTEFKIGISIYFYCMNLLLLFPLIINYFFIASRKADSILSESN